MTITLNPKPMTITVGMLGFGKLKPTYWRMSYEL